MLDSIKPTKHFAESMPQYFDEVFNIDIHNYTRFFEFKRMMKLEFDEVIVPDVDQDTYRTEKDRGLLYIACTRAMHRLTIMYAGERSQLLAGEGESLRRT